MGHYLLYFEHDPIQSERIMLQLFVLLHFRRVRAGLRHRDAKWCPLRWKML